jgi:hypothetical protein
VALAADGRAAHGVYFQLFAAALAGAALPWLGLLLLTALQAGAAQGWLLQVGVFFCWAVIVVQWSLVLLLLLFIGLKAEHADGPLARH